MMKALILNNKRELAFCEQEIPALNDGEILLDVEATSIGGSEYLGFNNPGIRPLPNIMGHGITGTTPSGDRVAVYPLQGCGECKYCLHDQSQLCDDWNLIGVQSDGGFAQKISVPDNALLNLPDDLSWEQSVFIEPFANSINAFDLSNANSSDSIAIIGAGSLGVGLTACANQNGCTLINVSDLSKNRMSVAIELGATNTNGTLHEKYDIVFDTVGSFETRSKAIELTKKGGRCVFLGFETPSLELDMSEIIRHQKQLVGSFVYSKSQFKKAITLVELCDKSWVTNVTFQDVEEHLLNFLDQNFDTAKVALRPNW